MLRSLLQLQLRSCARLVEGEGEEVVFTINRGLKVGKHNALSGKGNTTTRRRRRRGVLFQICARLSR